MEKIFDLDVQVLEVTTEAIAGHMTAVGSCAFVCYPEDLLK
ncbi:FDLD family class I lanthipeptide [Tumebacillus algifaecis]|nr:FDLD family class I lanthipeptide [Tumebacillus algifaecis]